MLRLLRTIWDIYLYACIHISLCTTLFASFSFKILGQNLNYYFSALIFGGTLVIYNGHRIISAKRLSRDATQGRFETINRIKPALLIAILVGLLISGFSFLKLSSFLKITVLPLSLISVLYFIPIFPNQKRLRDYPFIKLWLIAMVYAILCRSLILQANSEILPLVLSSLEALFFLVAITIPFDIRDMDIDQNQSLQSIPTKYGAQKALAISLACLVVSILLGSWLFIDSYYQSDIYYSLLCTFLISGTLILFANKYRSDAYFTFLLDGTLALPLMFYILIIFII